jgi:hypothetical protein
VGRVIDGIKQQSNGDDQVNPLEMLLEAVINIKRQGNDQQRAALNVMLRQMRDQALQVQDLKASEFFAALIAIMADQPASLPADHPYHDEIQRVIDGIARSNQGILSKIGRWFKRIFGSGS